MHYIICKYICTKYIHHLEIIDKSYVILQIIYSLLQFYILIIYKCEKMNGSNNNSKNGELELICPICKGNDCIVISIAEMYLSMIERFLKHQDKNSSIIYQRYPTVGDVGECKETFKRIWLCPYCKRSFESNYALEKTTINCPNCDGILCIPVSHRTFC